MADASSVVAKNFVLAPSDLTFLLDDCPRCFYLKIVSGIRRQKGPMPKIFTVIDGHQKVYFEGGPTESVDPNLPGGTVCHSGMAVASSPIETLNGCTVQFRGAIDALLAFADGTYGIVDYKTTDPRDTNVHMYGRQLHAYAIALEYPSPGTQQFSPVTTLGLLCMQPTGMIELDDGDFAYRIGPHWIEIERNDADFCAFIEDIVAVLSQPHPPTPNARCAWCALELPTAA